MTFVKFNPNEIKFTESSDYNNEEMLKSYNSSVYNWRPGMKDEDGNMLKLRMTKSTLLGYAFCPYQYFLEKILGHRSQETMWMVRGTNVHSIVEYFWKEIPEHIPELQRLISESKEASAFEYLKGVIPKPPQPYEHGEESVIDTWLKWQWDRFLITNGENWLPVGNEQEIHCAMEIEIDGKTWPIHMKGYIDTIFSDGDGGFIIMELKTGKWTPRKASYMRKEMQIYKMMLENGKDGERFLPVTHWAWEFPSGEINGGTKREWEIEEMGTNKSRYAPKSVKNLMEKVMKSHIENDFQPIHKSTCKSYCRHENLCSWCDYMDLCPAWNGGIENEE